MRIGCLLLVVLALGVGCVLRPSLDGRACDDENPCISADYFCAEGVCVLGDGGPPRVDAGAREDAGLDVREDGGRDADAGPDAGGLDDGGLDDAGPDAGGLDDGGLTDGGHDDAGPIQIVTFGVTPDRLPAEGGVLSATWTTTGSGSCRLSTTFLEVPDLPANGSWTIRAPRSLTLSLFCGGGGGDDERHQTVYAGYTAKILAVGDTSSCAVLDNGRVKCWGLVNADPQVSVDGGVLLGDEAGEMGDALSSLPLPNGLAYELAGDYAHFCAVMNTGEMTCWGSNPNGALGNESTDDVWVLGADDPQTPLLDFAGKRPARIDVGFRHSCATFVDGTAACWGGHDRGALGLGDLAGPTPGSALGTMGAALPELDLAASVVDVSLGDGFGCARLAGNAVKCWGRNDFAQLGVGDNDDRGDDDGEMGAALPLVELGASAQVVQVEAGGRFACARLSDGGVKCWGQNDNGQLGLGIAEPVVGDDPLELGEALDPVDLGGEARSISLGFDFACAILVDNSLKCWGGNAFGQLGRGDVLPRGGSPSDLGAALLAVDLGTGVDGDPHWVRLADAGTRHICVTLGDRSLKCWGDNAFGQLGLGNTSPRGDGPGEMGDDLPRVDLGTIDPTTYRFAQVDRVLSDNCVSCHDGAAGNAYPPLNGCAATLVSDGTYTSAGVNSADDDDCLHWHLTQEVSGASDAAPNGTRIDLTFPDRSLLLRRAVCASLPCFPADPSDHPAVLSDITPGSAWSYLMHWIAGGAPP